MARHYCRFRRGEFLHPPAAFARLSWIVNLKWHFSVRLCQDPWHKAVKAKREENKTPQEFWNTTLSLTQAQAHSRVPAFRISPSHGGQPVPLFLGRPRSPDGMLHIFLDTWPAISIRVMSNRPMSQSSVVRDTRSRRFPSITVVQLDVLFGYLCHNPRHKRDLGGQARW